MGESGGTMVCRDHGQEDPARFVHQRLQSGEIDSGVLKSNNEQPKPFVWTVNADLILGKIRRL
jgi:hypothetical protein